MFWLRPHSSAMPDAPTPELLRSLGRLVRGLSALFWGLPLALLICVQSAKMDWLQPLNIFPALAATGLLLFGLMQLGAFHRGERLWQNALDRARFFALVNCGLSPFLFWWNHLPENSFFGLSIALLALSALLFLFCLNLVLQRLGDMLPDEALRLETRQFTALNRTLLAALLLLASLYAGLAQIPSEPDSLEKAFFILSRVGPWLLLFLGLLPLAMTMALIWKIKEFVLAGVFGAR